jgi:hypothetical protein
LASDNAEQTLVGRSEQLGVHKSMVHCIL